MCRACELSIKRSMKKKDNGEVYKLRKTFAVFLLLEEELIGRLAYGWLLSDVVVVVTIPMPQTNTNS